MSKHLRPTLRLATFAVFGGILVWLGTTRPKVVGSGPSVVVVKQGTNITFEPQNMSVRFVVNTTNPTLGSPQSQTRPAQ
jgi:hypothetical protein